MFRYNIGMKLQEMLSGIKACIFDMDGTLVDSLGMWSDIDRRFFARYGMETPADYEKKINHMSFLEMAQFTKEEYQIPDSVETITELWTEWSKEEYESEIQAKPGAQELLQFLKEQGIPLSLATTNRKELYEPCLRRNHLYSYFDYIMNVNEINSAKSEPKIYQLLAAKMNVKPEETLVFEDILIAVNTAHQAGFKVAAVYDKRNERDQQKIKTLSDFYFKSFLEEPEKL